MNKTLESKRSTAVVGKNNHYVIKNGKIASRQDRLQTSINYRWIPSSQINKPSTQDYYKQTVRRLETELRDLLCTLKNKEQEWSNKFYQENQNQNPASINNNLEKIKRDYEYQLKSISEQLRNKEQEVWRKESQVRSQYENRLRQSANELRNKQDVLKVKENQIRQERLEYDSSIRNVEEQFRQRDRVFADKERELVTLRNQYQTKIRSMESQSRANLHNDQELVKHVSVSDQKIMEITEQLRHRQLELSVKENQLRNERERSHKQLQESHKQLREAQLRIVLQDTELRMKETELKEKDLDLGDMNVQLEKKDKLIQYQLGVVDKLILEIEIKERQEQQAYQNPEDFAEFYPEEDCQSGGNPSEVHSCIEEIQKLQMLPVQSTTKRVIESNIVPMSCQERQVSDTIAPLTLDDFPKSMSQSSIKYQTPERNGVKSASTGDIFEEEFPSVEASSRISEDLLSENLNTWSQWASNTTGPTFFSDLLNQNSPTKEGRKVTKSSEEDADPASGILNELMGRFTGLL